MKTLSFVSLLLIGVSVADVSYLYKGGEWPDMCSTGVKQSPIDFEIHEIEATKAHVLHTDDHIGSYEDSDLFTSFGVQVHDAEVKLGLAKNTSSSKSSSSGHGHGHRLLNSEAAAHHGGPELNSNISFHINDAPAINVSIADTGYTYLVTAPQGTLIFFDHEKEMHLYNLLQLHIHCPSEHTIDGEHYDCEIHFVHRNYDQTKLAVIAVFFDVEKGGDSDNDFITSLRLLEIPTTTKTKVLNYVPIFPLLEKIDKDELLHYEGSLTTPPCSEVVNWLVVNDPQPISTSQLKYFKDKWQNNFLFAKGNGNHRGTMPLQGRTIYVKGEHALGFFLRSASLAVTLVCLTALYL